MIELSIGLLIKGFVILYYIHRLAKEAKLYGTALEAKKAKFIADGAEEWDSSQETISVTRKFMRTQNVDDNGIVRNGPYSKST